MLLPPRSIALVVTGNLPTPSLTGSAPGQSEVCLSKRRSAAKNRLLFIVNDASFFVSHRLPLARAAFEQGSEVHVAARPDRDVDDILAAGLIFHPIAFDRTGLTPWREIRALAELGRLIRQVRPNLIHSITIKPVLYGGLLARLLNVPAFIAAVSGQGRMFDRNVPSLDWTRRLILPFYRTALGHLNGRVIFQNPDDRRDYVARGLVCADRTVLIHGSGVDPARFSQAPEAAGDPVVLLPARLLWAKGVREFVEAARRLREEGSKARFVLAGDPPAGDPSAVPENQLRAWHQEGVVEWWGYQKDMPAVHSRACIVCLPSSYREGIPKALIEAASCGRPIVTTDTPGCREICRHGENGLLVPKHDVEALVSALRRLLADPGLRQSMGAAGRSLVGKEFSLAKVIEQTLNVYSALGIAISPGITPSIASSKAMAAE